MKKIVFLFSFFLFVVCLINCSDIDQPDVQMENNSKASPSFMRNGGGIEVGYVDKDGNLRVHNDSIGFVKRQWEADFQTGFSNFRIEHLISVDDPNNPNNKGGEEVFLLMGTGDNGQTTGMVVSSTSPVIDPRVKFIVSTAASFSVSCNGCTSGCSIQPYGGNGQLAYRCANPCSTCAKSETLTNAPIPTKY